MKRFGHIVWVIIVCLGLGSASAYAQMNTDRLTAIGRNALYFNDYVLSIQYFNQVIKIKPYLAEPYLLRAIAKYQLSDYQGALRDCDNAIERNPFQPGAYYTRGFIYLRTKQLKQAEKDFSEALVFAPENKTYMILRADTRSELGEYELAMQDINYLLNREPQSPTLLFEKGAICLKQSDTLCALNSFLKATEYDSQNAGNWSALGLVYMMMDEQDDALVALNKAILQGSKWAGDYINRGILFTRMHNYRNAMTDYEKAVELAPDNAECYFDRGMLRQELGDLNHAVEDFSKALDIDPNRIEICYQRGTVLMQLKQWNEAMNDFNRLIERYPYFLPSYYLAAQAQTALGNHKQAYDLRKQAADLEQHKDSIQQAKSLQTDPQLAAAQPNKKDHRKEFSSLAAQNKDVQSEDEPKYSSEARGNVQKRYTDVVNEPNMVLTYYSGRGKETASLRQTNYSHVSVEQYNRKSVLPSPLQFTTHELSLSADMINQHFQQISYLTDRIDALHQYTSPGSQVNQQLSVAYLARAFEFSLVQDYTSAIEDITRATMLDDHLYFAYFCRANWRYKLLEYRRAMGEKTEGADFELMLRDYDYVVHNMPDFSFAYYNKANMLCIQRDFKAAIQYYSLAIEQDADFAEAYYNRGLTRIFIDQHAEGIADLSKAGELGIYQAYNLITRFQ